ncbi:MFS transporter [Cupriavidus metallidurans]|uniref:MFS transporter n=1 Tax=Cupriavidus TaxID=106589 RepID=UPI000E8FB974|nr:MULTISPECIES: MFS transporter [unclassified Cupriavidus]GMG95116.1 MFS transporter [Cupriavidus sp. TKC]HBD37592.1 aromatic acid/H+ symport family MFS transporter [Cupriavidus sp.]HBO78168.1 aromatic acid/H+ symport family MFS transporter [Cupriavidus sp.]
MTSVSRTLDVQQFINEHRFSRYQWKILVTCFLLIAIDAYDGLAIGFVVPVLVREWGVNKAAFGPVLSVGVLGLALGALLAGPLYHRTSPKTVIIGSMLLFGVCSLGTMTANSLVSLGVWRFFTGIGVGAAVPGAATLMYEYAPRRMSAFLVNAIAVGALIGASACGLTAAAMVPTHGWTSVFLIGGVLPIVLAVFMLAAMPQPLHFMVQKGYPGHRIAAVLRRIAPNAAIDDDTRFVLPEAQDAGKQGVAVVLSKQFRTGSVLLWAAYFFGTFAYYLLVGWLPTLVQDMGASLRNSQLITVLLTVGGIVGTFLFGWLMDRFDKYTVVALAYALGGIGIWLVGQQRGDLAWVAVCVFAGGIGLSGALMSMGSLAAAFYPASGRSTGISWMHGIGRFGGIVGPMVGAYMLRDGFSLPAVFTVVMVFVLLSSVALIINSAAARRSAANGMQTESA